jgi:hypothetical protein
MAPEGAENRNSTDENGDVNVIREPAVAHGEDGWKTLDEGFRMTVPTDWQKEYKHGIDSHVGAYQGQTAGLEFDEVSGIAGYTAKESKAAIKEYKKKESHPKFLKPGEEIWHVDGRIALFWSGRADPNERRADSFSYVAWLSIPYDGVSEHLYICVSCKSREELPTARRVLKSLQWQRKNSEKSEGG